MADRVKLAFIGSGNITKAHLDQGLKNFDDVDFVGWCDLNTEQANARKEQVGGRGEIFTDAEKMLDTARPDAVYIMLPPFAHGPVEQMVIDRKIPFFIEKPVAIDLDTAKRVQEGVAKADLLTSVGYMNRYREGVQTVRSLLGDQTPVLLHGGWMGPGMDPENPIGRWWYDKSKSGGQFIEQATHTTDLARYLFGDVKSVYASAVTGIRENMRPEHDAEHASMVQLNFKSGAIGNLYSSCCTPLGGGISLTAFTNQMHAAFTGWGHDVTINLPEGETRQIAAEPDIFGHEDRAFVDAVKTGNRKLVLATYEDGLHATAIGQAANDSMKTGQVVELNI